MPRYFECPDESNFTILNNNRISCDNLDGSNGWIELDVAPTTLIDLLSTPMFSIEERLLISGSIALFFATCWCFNVLGKQLFPKG